MYYVATLRVSRVRVSQGTQRHRSKHKVAPGTPIGNLRGKVENASKGGKKKTTKERKGTEYTLSTRGPLSQYVAARNGYIPSISAKPTPRGVEYLAQTGQPPCSQVALT
jgi:hypothetical protein